jgi:predicted metal-dependent enzyme (double-stranded beta helix superfamily)
MTTTAEAAAPPRGIEPLVHLVDGAVGLGGVAAITRAVQEGLSRLIHDGALALPRELRRTEPGHYARRLVYRSGEHGYVVVAMVWGPGQRTPLHDHAGTWCVEGVLEGRIEVTQYDLVAREGGRCRFRRMDSVSTGVGAAGALIPPFEYHTIANAREQASITLHVYGGDLTRCSVFEPEPDGLYRERHKDLAYDH